MLAAGESQVGGKLSLKILSARVGKAGVTGMVRPARTRKINDERG
jgi:hypothetical protein